MPTATPSNTEPKRLYQVQLESSEAIYNFEIATNDYDAAEIAHTYTLSMPEPFAPRSPTFLTHCSHIGEYDEEMEARTRFVVISASARNTRGYPTQVNVHNSAVRTSQINF